MEAVLQGQGESYCLNQRVMGSCVAGSQLYGAAGAVGSSLMGKLLCKGMDSDRPCTPARHNPHLWSVYGRQAGPWESHH